MASNDKKISEEIMQLFLITYEAGKQALVHVMEDKLFHYFLKDNEQFIKPALLESEVPTLYPKEAKYPKLEDLTEVSILNTIMQKAIPSNTGAGVHVSALRATITSYLKTDILRNLICLKKLDMKKLNERKHILSRIQLRELDSGKALHEFDITQLHFLISTLFGIEPTSGRYDKQPKPGHVSVGDDILRIKIFRNELAHLNVANLKPANATIELEKAILRLGGSKLQVKLTEIKNRSIDKDVEAAYEALKLQWMNEDRLLQKDIEHWENWMKQELWKNRKEIQDIIKQSYNHIKETAEFHQMKTEQKVDSLIAAFQNNLPSTLDTAAVSEFRKILLQLQSKMKTEIAQSMTEMATRVHEKVSLELNAKASKFHTSERYEAQMDSLNKDMRRMEDGMLSKMTEMATRVQEKVSLELNAKFSNFHTSVPYEEQFDSLGNDMIRMEDRILSKMEELMRKTQDLSPQHEPCLFCSTRHRGYREAAEASVRGTRDERRRQGYSQTNSAQEDTNTCKQS